ncbi:1,2-phenylacetyl-CoA epoxidase subunit PaaB [Haloferacaceae archaeon DSL9]
MIWEVFRQEKPGGYHTHCGNVHAPDREMAKLFAQIQHGRRMNTHSLWVVPQDEVAEVDAEETSFGGTTDKAYRWAMTYNDIRGVAEEVADSEEEQRKAAKQKENAPEVNS